MSDEEKEYEVEDILEAKVVSVSRTKQTVTWIYHVKWVGYEDQDNTWEPVSAFEDSMGPVHRFWQRAKQNKDDFKAFKKNDVVSPGAKKTKKIDPKRAQEVTPDEEEDVEELEASSPTKAPKKRGRPRKTATSSTKATTKRRRSSPIDVSDGEDVVDEEEKPPKKRACGRTSEPTTTSASARSTPAASTRAKRATSVAAKKTTRGRRGLSPGPSASTAGAKTKRGRQPAPEEEVVPDSEEEDEAMVVDNEKKKTAQSHVAKEDKMDDTNVAASSEPPKSPVVPSRRGRTAKPLVEMIDDPQMTDLDGAIGAKHRAVIQSAAHHMENGEPTTAVASGSTSNNARVSVSPERSGAAPPSPPVERVGPPRRKGKAGLAKAKASLLQFDKKSGGLKTRKAVYAPPEKFPTPEPEPAAVIVDEGGAAPWPDAQPGAQNNEPAAWPNAPPAPNGAELLALAGISTEKGAGALEDFIDEPIASPAPAPVVHTAVPRPNTLASNNLFSAGPSSASFSPELSAQVKRPTIWGLLGRNSSYGFPQATMSSESSNPSHLFLTLDRSTSIPLALKDVVKPFELSGMSIDQLVAQNPRGPPGRLWLGETASSLLAAFHCADTCARVIVHESASETESAQFDRFKARLYAGELFVAANGPHTLAYCSSENTATAKHLGVPAKLIGMIGSVLVTYVTIGDHDAYSKVVFDTDEVRWT